MVQPPTVQIGPSILSCDFANLGNEIAAVDKAGADWIHVDVMDGRFVPNLTVGPAVVRAVRRSTKLVVDVHLMIVEPERYLSAFADAGADILTVHLEATCHLARTLQVIHALGKKAGVALNPHTPEDTIRYVLGQLDLVLIMTVNPGFSGQAFLPEMLPKIQAVRRMIDDAGHDIALQVDGGVAPGTARRVTEAGARVLVAGDAVYGRADYAAAIDTLRKDAMLGANPGAASDSGATGTDARPVRA